VIARRIPDPLAALVFDMDGTLYRHDAYGRYQETSQVARLAAFLGLSEAETVARIAAVRESRRSAGLPKTSLATIFGVLGAGMEDIIRWREEEIRPAEWLRPDPRLASVLSGLSGRYRLALLTNNPRIVGEESLKALGIGQCFECVTGLDDTRQSKPAPAPFIAVCARLGLPPSLCLSIGDRMDVDIEPALALGMGGLLVEGVEEVYALPEYLAGR
jgi:phosphoglycolate phosphatase/putative hydrolase of the HAD superfamily